jgi:putative Ca2+/H+ antiporter (TMEM165/GDT1 family)
MACAFLAESREWLTQIMHHHGEMWGFQTLGSSFGLVFLAEFGDKSQLVCMTLSSRYRHWPVFWGAVAAFSLLNLIAVLFGSAISVWIPMWVLSTGVALLFWVFGLVQFWAGADDEETGSPLGQGRGHHGIFLTTLSLLLLAEFGDKTQLAVAGLSVHEQAVAVWLGSTLALVASAGLGIWAGRRLIARVSLPWIRRLSAVLFLVFGCVAFSNAWLSGLSERLGSLF